MIFKIKNKIFENMIENDVENEKVRERKWGNNLKKKKKPIYI